MPETHRSKDSAHLPILNLSVIPDCISPQDDATVKCWGKNYFGELGLGDTSHRGDDANGPCPPSSTSASFLSAPRSCPHSYSCSWRAEMGVNLTSVDLGAGRTAVAVRAGSSFTCALLVRSPVGRWERGDLQKGEIGPYTLGAPHCDTSAAATD